MTADRGQTAIDYTVGVGVFVIAVALTFSLGMNILAPTSAPNGHDNLVADRAATSLAVDQLADEQYVWNRTDVDAFFASSASDAADRLPLDDTHRLNVTLETDTERWTVGPSPPNRGSVGTAWRVGTLDGNRADLRIRVW